VAIGVAAGLATTDEAGNKELIGLAATAHVSIYPAWFGLKFIFGFNPSDKPMEFLLAFGIDVLTIIVFAALTFWLIQMKGDGIRSFVKAKETEKNKSQKAE
jgi:nucleoside permease NupC